MPSRHCFLCQLSWQEKHDCNLDLTSSDAGPLLVVGNLARLSCNPLKEVVDERVEDLHGRLGDSSPRASMLQYLTDFPGIGLSPLSLQFFLLWGLLAFLGSGLERLLQDIFVLCHTLEQT